LNIYSIILFEYLFNRATFARLNKYLNLIHTYRVSTNVSAYYSASLRQGKTLLTLTKSNTR